MRVRSSGPYRSSTRRPTRDGSTAYWLPSKGPWSRAAPIKQMREHQARSHPDCVLTGANLNQAQPSDEVGICWNKSAWPGPKARPPGMIQCGPSWRPPTRPVPAILAPSSLRMSAQQESRWPSRICRQTREPLATCLAAFRSRGRCPPGARIWRPTPSEWPSKAPTVLGLRLVGQRARTLGCPRAVLGPDTLTARRPGWAGGFPSGQHIGADA